MHVLSRDGDDIVPERLASDCKLTELIGNVIQVLNQKTGIIQHVDKSISDNCEIFCIDSLEKRVDPGPAGPSPPRLS